jgi:hypothetical protein
VSIIEATISEGCNQEPALHKILRNLNDVGSTLESAMPSTKFAFTGGVGGFNITNGGVNMFV